MEFSFNVDDNREGIRRAKEKVWEGLNEFGDFVSFVCFYKFLHFQVKICETELKN